MACMWVDLWIWFQISDKLGNDHLIGSTALLAVNYTMIQAGSCTPDMWSTFDNVWRHLSKTHHDIALRWEQFWRKSPIVNLLKCNLEEKKNQSTAKYLSPSVFISVRIKKRSNFLCSLLKMWANVVINCTRTNKKMRNNDLLWIV